MLPQIATTVHPVARKAYRLTLLPPRKTCRLPRKDEDGDTFTYTRMYYIDAYADEYSAPGKIHLFGKVWMEDKAICERMRRGFRASTTTVFLAKSRRWRV